MTEPNPAEQAKLLEEHLHAHGVIDPEMIDPAVALAESVSGDVPSPAMGARVVARAWADENFKTKLLTDPVNTLSEFLAQAIPIAVVENTAQVHHVIVCTLCSCYPSGVLGNPPSWYKSFEYRSRVVREPRAVLAEFGTYLDDGVEVVVHDSTAEQRYLVLPIRPAGTDGWSQEELATMVTRNSMIGTGLATIPSA
jgi:nitrile hydratase